MKCHAHPDATAHRSCHACLRPLCTACSHEVIGSFFCDACLTERLAVNEAPGSRTWVKMAWLSGVLSFLLPGLGQVYNGLVARGIAQFVIFVALIRIGGLAGGLLPLLVLGTIAFYFWQVVDAVSTARDFNRLGRVPDPEEARAMGRGPIPGADGGSRGLGITLVVVGTLLLLQNFHLGHAIAHLLRNVWPFALVGVGVWLLRRHRKDEAAARQADTIDYDVPGEADAEAAEASR